MTYTVWASSFVPEPHGPGLPGEPGLRGVRERPLSLCDVLDSGKHCLLAEIVPERQVEAERPSGGVLALLST